MDADALNFADGNVNVVMEDIEISPSMQLRLQAVHVVELTRFPVFQNSNLRQKVQMLPCFSQFSGLRFSVCREWLVDLYL